ncbi:unnamed protein product, partial [Musa hybrid cultivar]
KKVSYQSQHPPDPQRLHLRRPLHHRRPPWLIQLGFTARYTFPHPGRDHCQPRPLPSVLDSWFSVQHRSHGGEYFQRTLRRTSGAKERSRSDLFSGSRQDLIMMKLSEIVPKNLRGALGSVDQLSVAIDLFLAYLMGMLVRWRLLKVKGHSFELS